MNNCRVLLADDEAAILEGYKLLFDWEKYQCEIAGTAMDGQEALRLRVSDFLLKPIDFDVFGEVIQGIVQKIMENPNRQPVLSETLKKIVGYINENLENEDMRLTLLAENMNMNPNYISQLFKKELGCGYHAYLNQARVEKAKIYLRQTNEPITAVAEKVGFSDYRIFTKIFKGIVGETPSQFRK